MSSWFWLTILTLLPCLTTPLNSDGALLLTFKSSILADPLSALHNWNSKEKTPCSWNGVTCTNISTINNATANSRVTSLVLPNTKLVGFIPSSLFLIDHLQHLDLSSNFLNATLPTSLLNASELCILSLANNEISGNLPELAGGQLSSLHVLNLSNNALTGGVPTNLSLLPNLTVVSLANNYLSGCLAGGGYRILKVLDISSNLINGSLPKDLGGPSLRYLNLSHNRLVGSIPSKLVSTNPFETRLNLDLSFNNLTGQIPQVAVYLSQNSTSFTGNIDLCGRPLREQCAFLSEFSDPASSTEITAPTAFKSPPALAAIPRYPNGDALGERAAGGRAAGLRPAAIVAITVGDVGGIGLLLIVFFYVYKAKKKNKDSLESQGCQTNTHEKQKCLSCCLKKLSDSEESSESSCEIARVSDAAAASGVYLEGQHKHQEAILVTVDGGTELELESLLKASAYILGATASSIVYKAVLADGTTLAVRRVGDGSTTDRLRDFEARVRSIAKLRHPNLLPIRGLYWGADEKLLIHHYASNGSLANIPFTKKTSSSPLHLSWACRLRIATGVARGLAYLHDRKCVHGNIKPSNILLAEDMEPWIGDFGLDRLIPMATKSGRQFSSQRSCKSLPDLSTASSSSSSPYGSYQAPEALKSLKGNPKWDVYSFGVLLLELLAGRMFTETEMCRWNAGFVVEERGRVLRMADPALRAEVEGKEMDLLVCFKLGFACAAVAPQRRPSMADAVQVLDKISFSP